MIERLCQLLLRRAAGRWGDSGEMLAEWRAELSAMDSPLARLKFASSLAVSRPRRIGVVALRRAVPGLVLSLVLILRLPDAYLAVSNNWWILTSSDPVARHLWLAAANAAGAVVLAIAAARLTGGLTRVIRPMWLPLWVFGLPFVFLLAQGYPGNNPPILIDLSMSYAAAIAFGMVAVHLTRRDRPVAAWACVAVAVPALFLMANLHGIGHYLLSGAEFPSFYAVDATTLYLMVVQPAFYLTLFGLAYVRSLAARVRTADRPRSEAVRAPL